MRIASLYLVYLAKMQIQWILVRNVVMSESTNQNTRIIKAGMWDWL